MKFETIKFERQGHIGILSLNRPERLNVLTLENRQELREFFTGLTNDLETRVVILRGEGRVFCAGADVKTMVYRDNEGLGEIQHLYYFRQKAVADIAVCMRKAPQPIIAAVRGAAAGGGFALALASDARVIGQSARFNTAFIRVGLSACDLAVSYFLPRLIGLSRASEYMLTGRFMDAATAERFGLVSRLVPDDQVDAAAQELANEMLQNSPLGLRMTKEVLNTNIDAHGLESAIQLENRTQTLCCLTEDNKEAAQAFLEKRAPVFQDK
jgi:enoyl-CoA hydratase/carnithine racemase